MSDNNIDFEFLKGEPGDPKAPYPNTNRSFPHRLLANQDGSTIGKLSWHYDTGDINDVYVMEKNRRQGIATNLFQHATHLSTQFNDVPPPRHSAKRTEAGDSWAKAVGGDIPEITPYHRQGGIWDQR
jgi:GNAT superfamily N-acetyltransferase